MQRLQGDIWIACSTDSVTLTVLKETARSLERLTAATESNITVCLINDLHAESVQAVRLGIFAQWQNKKKISVTSAYNDSTTGKTVPRNRARRKLSSKI